MTFHKLTFIHTFNLGDFGEIEVRLTGNFLPRAAGQLSGPAERCSPPEPAEFEPMLIESVGTALHDRRRAYTLRALLMDQLFDLTDEARDQLCIAAEDAWEGAQEAAMEDAIEERKRGSWEEQGDKGL